jgi:thiamine-monophosphate kinase
MIDVSDGLLADLEHIAVASSVRIELTSAAIPAAPDVLAAAESLGADPWEWLLGGGDDHCFAATVPASISVGLPCIGAVSKPTAKAPAGVVIDRVPPKLAGHEHFRS